MTDQERTRWTKLVADYEASELTQREFATEREISFSNLRNWIYRLRKESRPLVQEAKVSGQAPERGSAAEGSRLLPVRVVASAAKPRRAASAAAVGDALLELALPRARGSAFRPARIRNTSRALATAL